MRRVGNDGKIPPEAQYLFRKALSLSLEGKKVEALKYLRQAILIAPRFCKALNEMGNCLDEIGRYDEALIKFDRVIDIDPDHAEARFKREMSGNKISSSNLPQQGRDTGTGRPSDRNL